MIDKELTFVAEDDGYYSLYCCENANLLRYHYTIREEGDVTICRVVEADGSFGDPLDFDLITELLYFHRLRKRMPVGVSR